MIKLRGKSKVDEDLGFGKIPTSNNQRLLTKDGKSNVRRKGLPFFKPHEAYNSLIFMNWSRFMMLIGISYLLLNLLFAAIYFSLGMEHLLGANGKTSLDKFFDAFFFSAQTISTVGYGHISPAGFATSIFAALESMMGLLVFALATSLLYGRFSRPTAKIHYSDKMLISPYKNGDGLMFRLANLRSNQLIELEISLLLSINVIENGEIIRRFLSLDLERKTINLLTLSWTVVHPITAESALFSLNQQDLINGEAEFIVMLKAFDDAFSQVVHSRTSYKGNEVIFNAKFDAIIHPNDDGIFSIDISKVGNYSLLKD